MTTRQEQPETPHSTTVTDSASNETGATGHQSAVCDQMLFSVPDNDVTSPIVQKVCRHEY